MSDIVAPTIFCSVSAPVRKGGNTDGVAGWNLWIPAIKDSALACEVSAGSAVAAGSGFALGMAIPADRLSGWQAAEASVNYADNTRLLWGDVPAKDRARQLPIQPSGTIADSGFAVAVNTLTYPRDSGSDLIQLSVDLYSIRPSEYDLRRSELLTDLAGLLDMTSAPYIPSGLISWSDYELTERRATPMDSNAASTVHQPPARDRETVLPWGNGVSLYYSPGLPFVIDPTIITPGEFPEPDAAEVHIIMNSVNVYDVATGTALAVADIKIELDEDSYSWVLTAAVLNEASKALLKADSNGMKELVVEINGHQWLFFIPMYGHSKSIDDSKLNKTYTITGYSRTQYLAAPYAPKRTRSIGTTTAVQAVTDELNGTGFSLVWDTADLTDWPMNNAVYSYQETACLSAIKKVAEAVGAVIYPAPAADQITVRPRRVVAPWELAEADTDRTIHESQILGESCSYEINTLINAIWVSGEQEGCSYDAILDGTAGDEPGDDVTHIYLTALEANQARARQEIAGGGNNEIYTLELAIPESSSQPGLLVPGLTVAVSHDDSGKDWRGYVTALSVSAAGRGGAKVRQSVTIRRPIGWEAA